jgi:hypothetical protein
MSGAMVIEILRSVGGTQKDLPAEGLGERNGLSLA